MPVRQTGGLEPDLLARCLADLDERGWDLDDYLAGRPEIPASMRVLLQAAAQVQRAPRPAASAELRARLAARLAADRPPRRSAGNGWLRSLQDALVPVTASVGAVLVLAAVIGGIGTASATSLPGTPLYPAKIAVESVQLFAAYSPELQAQTHLKIAGARLVEAGAENQRGNLTEVDVLLKSYQQQIVDARAAAASASSPEYPRQVDQAVATLDAKRTEIVPRVLAPTVTPTASATAAGVRAPSPTVTPRPTAPVQKDQGVKPAAPTSTPAAPPSVAAARPQTRRSVGRPEDLVATLIERALAGDQPGAAAASAEFVADLSSGPDLKQSAIVHLRRQRARLADALSKAPGSTAPSLQQALRAADTVLGSADRHVHPPGNDSNPNHPNGSSDSGGPGDQYSGGGRRGGPDGHSNGSGKGH
ncbi:MAG: DUF5667 domain-containing protein [Chloroflexota bacterium]